MPPIFGIWGLAHPVQCDPDDTTIAVIDARTACARDWHFPAQEPERRVSLPLYAPPRTMQARCNSVTMTVKQNEKGFTRNGPRHRQQRRLPRLTPPKEEGRDAVRLPQCILKLCRLRLCGSNGAKGECHLAPAARKPRENRQDDTDAEARTLAIRERGAAHLKSEPRVNRRPARVAQHNKGACGCSPQFERVTAFGRSGPDLNSRKPSRVQAGWGEHCGETAGPRR